MAAMHERASRNTELGDRACFCVSCGWARRYMPGAVAPPSTCPACAADVISACPSCGTDVLSIMVVECDVCGAALRDRLAGGVVQIRRAKRLPMISLTPDAPVEPAAAPATPAEQVVPVGTSTASSALETEPSEG